MEAATPAPRRPHIHSLTSIRFFAALWVVLLHFGMGTFDKAPAPVRHFTEHGQLGVALFFILSGFVLGYNYLDKAEAGRLNLKDFFISRFARLYPVYILSIAVYTPFAIKHVLDRFDRAEGIALLGQMTFLQAFMLQAWTPHLLYASNWNTPSWSLSDEMFFYLCFPFLAGWLARAPWRTALLTIGSLILVAGAMRYGYAAVDPDKLAGQAVDVTKHTWAGFFYFNPAVRLLEFCVGICMVRLMFQHGEALKSIPRGRVGWIFTGVLLLTLALYSFPHDVWAAVWTYPATIILLGGILFLVALQQMPTVDRFFRNPTMLLLGEASFSMYMLQRPVGVYLNQVLKRVGMPLIEASAVSFMIFLLILIGVSIATFKLVEMPARNWIRDRLSKKRVPAT